MSYGKVTIAFFTGTGNSYRVATWMAEAARTGGVTTRLVPIRAMRPEEVDAGPDDLLGFICPTHGFTIPWAMLRFVLGLPHRWGTHAGTRLGHHFLPGMTLHGDHVDVLLRSLSSDAPGASLEDM